MRSVVMKFGGSSVVDAAAIDRVTSIVTRERARGSTPVVVVSALGGVTDALLALAEGARTGNAEGVDALSARHLGEAATLGAMGDPSLAASIEGHFDDLRAALRAIERGRRVDPAESDLVASVGELVSSRIVAAALSARGLPAVWVDAREVIVTDDRHTCALPLLDETRNAAGPAISPLVAAGRITVLGGFVGRIGLFRVARGRGHRRLRNPDLDRRGRHAHRRPADRSGH
jgi:aspartate kinase